MQTITIADYLKEKEDSKKVQKRINRAIKIYRHAARDLAHATGDIAHAKEDCLHAIQLFDAALEDCEQAFVAWATDTGEASDEMEEIHVEVETPESTDPDEEDTGDDFVDLGDYTDDEEDAEDDEEDLEEHPARQADQHLEHAAKDFSHAIEDAECVIDDLSKVESLLFDIMEYAEEDGYQIDFAEAKAYVVAQAAVSPAALEPTPG